MRISLLLSSALLAALPAAAQEPAPPLRFMLHGSMSNDLPTEDYLKFVAQVKPDLLVTGVFDQRLYAAFAPGGKKQQPLDPAEHLRRWHEIAGRLHKHGTKLIGQMELFVVSDRPAELDEMVGWFGFYERGWNDKLLGPRPTKSVGELLEVPGFDRGDKTLKDAIARCGCRVNPRAVRGCVHNPHWRAVQKAMVAAAIRAGVDGFITNRNYLEHCECVHCQAKFRAWLERRFTPQELRERFGITDLAKAALCVNGPHREHDAAPKPLDLERMRFARASVKDFFDDVYVRHGRKLKPDLILSQWNHMAYFDELHLDRGHLPPATRTNLAHAIADERWGLPADVWGRDETFFWYCNWGTTQNTILEKEYAGDTVLYGKLLRSLARGRPYVINKYDFYRPRVMMAEAAALGYLTNAIATPWQTDEDREVVLRYFSFLRKHADLYEKAESYAEAALVFPRRALHAGDAAPLEYVEAAGRTLIRHHVLFDIVADDLLAAADLGKYRVVIVAAPEYLEKGERDRLADYVSKGGKILLTPVSAEDRDRPGAATEAARQAAASSPAWSIPSGSVANIRTNRAGFLQAFLKAAGGKQALSSFNAPWTVEAHAYRVGAKKERLVVHLVNYNHKEKAPGKSVAAREAPLAAEPMGVRLVLPEGLRARAVRFVSADDAGEHVVAYTQTGRVLTCRTPQFLVYGMLVIEG